MLAPYHQDLAAPPKAASTEGEAADGEVHSGSVPTKLGELRLFRTFLLLTAGFVILSLLILGSHLNDFPALHVLLDASNFALPLLAALLLYEIGRHSGDELLPALAMSFGTCSLLHLLHLASGLEWWGSLEWIAQSAAVLRPKMWTPSAYFLPLALMIVLARVRSPRESMRGLGIILGTLAVALVATFWNLAPYAEPTLYGMHRPLLLAVPVFWALVAVQASWLRPHHPIWQAVPLMAVLMIVGEAVMLRSSAPNDSAAMIGHTGSVTAFLLLLLAAIRLAAIDTRRRIEVQNELRALTQTLERRVAMRTSELQANLADLKAYERALQRQARYATLQAEVLLGFARREELRDILVHIASSVARELDVDVAQIWTLEPGSQELELRAHVGTDDITTDRLLPLRKAGIATIARRGEPLFTNEAIGDERIEEQEWLARHGFTAFAGYPLELEGDVKGIITVFARRRLEESELAALEFAASAIALGIAHKQYERELPDLYDHAPCGYHSLDENGLIVAMNATELSWIGYTREEIVGRKRFPEILTPDSRRTFARTFPRLKKTGVARDVEFELVRKDGTTFPILLNATAVVDRHGRFLASRAMTFDITERKRTEERTAKLNHTLARRSRELEEANRELESFSYTVSHDLRAPLRRIRGFAELLREDAKGKLPEAMQKYVQVITESSVEMGKLIDDFLQFSRTGRAEMREGRVDLGELVREVIGDYELPARKRGVTWHVQPLPEVIGDRGLLKQVIANLIDNALKYSRDRSEPRIEIGTAGSDSGQVVVFVRDNGVGFRMEEATRLFGVFQRLPNAHDYEGNGVGLATVQRILHRHGGRIWAESAENEGATFYFTLRPAGGAEAGAGRRQ
ncbi:MAG TPA: ATP-binding protein [Candidatus Limnocylindrales bacterium]|nr:ATP-binding protein [Candidatus Limnocylindrales bacterium]